MSSRNLDELPKDRFRHDSDVAESIVAPLVGCTVRLQCDVHSNYPRDFITRVVTINRCKIPRRYVIALSNI